MANTNAIVPLFDTMQQRFQTLYRRKAHVHHYSQYMDPGLFDSAAEYLRVLTQDYASISERVPQPLPMPSRPAWLPSREE